MLINPFRINFSSFFSLFWWNWPHLRQQISSLAVLFYFRVKHVKLSSQVERDAFQFALSQRLKRCSKAKMTKCVHNCCYRDCAVSIAIETSGFKLFLCCCISIIKNCFFLYFHHIVYRKQQTAISSCPQQAVTSGSFPSWSPVSSGAAGCWVQTSNIPVQQKHLQCHVTAI